MRRHIRDRSLEALLDLDGEVMVVDPAGKHWVRFSVTRVEVSPERPHGLSYALTLHAESGERLVGFDNAHPVRAASGPGGKAVPRRDHKHRLETVKPYRYKDAGTLLADFWTEVDAMLKERGVNR